MGRESGAHICVQTEDVAETSVCSGKLKSLNRLLVWFNNLGNQEHLSMGSLILWSREVHSPLKPVFSFVWFLTDAGLAKSQGSTLTTYTKDQ